MRKIEKQKVFGFHESSVIAAILIFIAFISFFSGLAVWGQSDELPDVIGGKSAVISVVFHLMAFLLQPIFGDKSIAIVFFLLTAACIGYIYKIKKG